MFQKIHIVNIIVHFKAPLSELLNDFKEVENQRAENTFVRVVLKKSFI